MVLHTLGVQVVQGISFDGCWSRVEFLKCGLWGIPGHISSILSSVCALMQSMGFPMAFDIGPDLLQHVSMLIK